MEEHPPFDTAAMFAWANLVGAIIDTMGAAGVPNLLIHSFLDQIEEANRACVPERAREAYLATTAVLRDGMPSND
ncbi:hypothetical protein [Sphingomonas sp. BE137]|uniref:hypothetical protein n=1 Tax=Sphingomonas sp. BE137 TaxID=2817844 RepID=UPI001AE9C4C7|nr:hypothetical protein [Sphingomonas sp. BE137]MDR6850333.1 hypothetical protein [Sphingomonas sp. BE137]